MGRTGGESAGRGAASVAPGFSGPRKSLTRFAVERSWSMDRFVGIRPLLRLTLLAPLLLIIQPSWGDARTQNLHTQSVVRQMRPQPQPRPEVAAMNAWTVGLAGGLLEGAPIRLAAEIARVVDDGDNLHVLP